MKTNVLSLKKTLWLWCFFVISYHQSFATTATISQPNTIPVHRGTTYAEILTIAVYANPGGSVTSMTFNNTGTTSPSDISNARLWYGGSCNSFLSSCSAGGNNCVQVGSAVVDPCGTFTFTFTQAIPVFWTHYFFLTFDISSTAVIGNTIDAQCTSYLYSATGATPQTTIMPSPAGNRVVAGAIGPNIVPNPSIETYSSCPLDGAGDMGRATPWDQPTNGSADFIRGAPCTIYEPWGGNTPPPARTGLGLAGISTRSTSSEYREYIQTPLSTPLIAGHTYYAEMYLRNPVVGAGGSYNTCGTDEMGMYFSTTKVRNPIISVLSYTPQVKASAPVIDAANWVQVSGTFVATGCENYLIIGDFWNNLNTTWAGTCNATSGIYYWIDDILVQDLTGGGTPCDATPSSSCPLVLPIELVSFNGNCIEPNEVRLNWVTASETNNDYFTIERSSDGKVFESIGIVPGAGNSSSTLTYLFTDDSPLIEINYYRLKQTDFNGVFEYSKTIATPCKNDDVSSNIFPNPAQNQLTFTYNNTQKSTDILSLYITNSLGEMIIQNTYKYESFIKENLDISILSNGVYHVIFTTNTTKEVHKLVVSK